MLESLLLKLFKQQTPPLCPIPHVMLCVALRLAPYPVLYVNHFPLSLLIFLLMASVLITHISLMIPLSPPRTGVVIIPYPPLNLTYHP